MQQYSVRFVVISLVCLLAACTTPWGGDVGCFNLASYVERIDCQTRGHRTVSDDEKLRRKEPFAPEKPTDAADPLCYTKAGEGEKPCAK